MDVTRSISPATKSTDVNRRKALPSATWDRSLNHASAKPITAAAHGVAHPKTLDTAHISTHDDKTAKRSFAKLLDTATTKQNAAPPKADLSKLEKTSQTLVNQFFMGSMLKQMRDDPFKDEMFSGGKGGGAYAGLFDQHIAEHAGNRIAKGLVKSMVKQYQRAASAVPAAGMAA